MPEPAVGRPQIMANGAGEISYFALAAAVVAATIWCGVSAWPGSKAGNVGGELVCQHSQLLYELVHIAIARKAHVDRL